MDCGTSNSNGDGSPAKRFKKDDVMDVLPAKENTAILGDASNPTTKPMSLDEDEKTETDGSARIFLMPRGTIDRSIQISEKAAMRCLYIKEVIDGRRSDEYVYERDPNDPSRFLLDQSGKKIVRAVVNEVQHMYANNKTEPERKDEKPLYSFIDVEMPEYVKPPYIKWVADYLDHHRNDADDPTQTTPLLSNDPTQCINDKFDINLTNEILKHSENQETFYDFCAAICSLGIHSLEALNAKRIGCMLFGKSINYHCFTHICHFHTITNDSFPGVQESVLIFLCHEFLGLPDAILASLFAPVPSVSQPSADVKS